MSGKITLNVGIIFLGRSSGTHPPVQAFLRMDGTMYIKEEAVLKRQDEFLCTYSLKDNSFFYP